MTDALAIRVLERGFSHVLHHGGEPLVMRLTDEKALALALWDPPPKGWPSFMAAGLDRLGRASYVSRPAKVDGVPAMEARRKIEVCLLAELRPVLEDISLVSAPGGWA